jgi:hypothetical protein
MNGAIENQAVIGVPSRSNEADPKISKTQSLHTFSFQLFCLMLAATVWLIFVSLVMGFFRR